MSHATTHLFARLRGLFSTTGFPLEDFLSEIVAAVIQRHPTLFIEWLREVNVLEIPLPITLSVETQFYCRKDDEDETPEKYPDFLVRLTNGRAEQLVFIESKVGSDLSGEDQLQIYARILSRMHATHRTLLFITKDYYPQDPNQVLALVPEDRLKLKFAQARWFQFARFLSRKGNPALDDPLVIELLSFMKSQQLTQNHQFTPQDIAALTGFQHAHSVMRSVIDDELRDRLGKVCGELMDEWDSDVQTIRAPMCTLRNRLKTRNIGVNVGFWLGPNDEGYPWVFADISFDAKSIGKEQIIEAMLYFASISTGWFTEGLSAASAFGRIIKGRSLSTFLGEPNHAAAIKQFLFSVIEEIDMFKAHHPGLAWTR